jgi:putative nucleotidyltransferase with HDIG domain
VQTAVAGLRHGICDYISKPFDVVEVSSAVSRALARKRSRAHLIQFLEGVGTVLGKDRDSIEVLDDLKRNPELQDKLSSVVAKQERRSRGEPAPTDDAEDSTLEFLDVLAQALESRDGELRKHAQRVGFYADLITEQLGVDEGTREYIRTSSFLHDIGKVALSDEDKERAQLRSIAEGIPEEEHPEIGAKLVQPLGFEERVADAIRHHHEHWNGDGHPDGLRGEDIPLAARVIAVVDVFDKLTSDGRADKALSAEEATAELEKYSGSRLDPTVVDLFVALLESGDFEFQASGAAE